MPRKRLRKGVHWVNIGGTRRKVKVLASGKWRFMKGSRTKKGKKKGKRYKWVKRYY